MTRHSENRLEKIESWADYWNQDETWSKSKIWEINARRFVNQTWNLLNLNCPKRILDIGCGAGHLALILENRAKYYLGIDPSENLIREAIRKCSSSPNVKFLQTTIDSNSFSEHGPFDLILCVGVVQYFKNIQQVIELVQRAAACAAPGAKLLIADIPQPRTGIQQLGDALASLLVSVKERYCFDFLAASFKLLVSDYSEFSKHKKILFIDTQQLETKINALGYSASTIHSSVSICVNRPSVLIRF